MTDTVYVDENQNAWRLDVSADNSTWYQVFGISDSNFPGITPGLKDNSSYENNGWGTQGVTSNAASIECTAFSKASKDTGEAPQSLQLMRATIGEVGGTATLYARWGRTDNHTPYQGYTALVSVAMSPGNSGWDDFRSEKVTLAASGAVTKLDAAPAEWSTAAAPQVASITPTGAAVGDLVFISGSGFTGVTATDVDFGATPSVDAAVKTDSLLAVSIPSGATGTVSVTVTNATGTSTGLSYTVGS